MMLLRFVTIAGVLVATGIYAPAHAEADKTGAARTANALQAPLTSATPATLSFGSGDVEQKKKGDEPKRPRPKPGPKDGGEE